MTMPARELALRALLDRKGMVTRHLDRLLVECRPSPADAGLATELAHGVMRRRRTLDAIVAAYSSRPGRNPSPAVQQILRMGVYQLVFLDRVPAFAAVDESVKICRRRHARQAGFVNAVLRNIGRGLGPVDVGSQALDARSIPISPNRSRKLDRDALGDVAEDAVAFLGNACSLPDDLAARWLRTYGSVAKAFEPAMQVNARPQMVARVNTHRATVGAVLARLAGQGVKAAAHVNGRSIVFGQHVSFPDLDVFTEGLVTPQDATATAAAMELDVQPGMRVLDFCAAPGTKTTQLGEMLRGRGELVAVDVSDEKLQRVEEAGRRCGIDNLRTCPAGQVGSLPVGGFNRVLVDAPCSNTGVLARRVEARWRFAADRLGKLAGDQRDILTLASTFLAPGGRLVYSTCSVEPAENGKVVQAFLRKQPALSRVADRLTRPLGFASPEQYRDGGYWAVLA